MVDDSNSTPPIIQSPSTATGASFEPAGWWRGERWIPYLLPLIVYMAVPSLIGLVTPAPGVEQTDALWPPPYWLVYSVTLMATMISMLAVMPIYHAQNRRPYILMPTLIGAVGVVIWIALATLQHKLGWVIGAGERASFNPQVYWSDEPAKAYGFLLVRFVGLAMIVPVVEEFFLRGWLMRFVTTPKWWELRIGEFDLRGAAAATIVPMLMHPNEAIAAWVWFSMITWLLMRTRNIWDCVVAHGVTNLLLGLYVVKTGEWWLW